MSMLQRSGQMELLVDLAQDYGTKPLGEKVGYIAGVVVVVVLIVWGAAAAIRRIRRR
jgi:hypothetical protein